MYGDDNDGSAAAAAITIAEDLEQLEIDNQNRLISIKHNEKRLQQMEAEQKYRREKIDNDKAEVEQAARDYKKRENRINAAAQKKFQDEYGYDPTESDDNAVGVNRVTRGKKKTKHASRPQPSNPNDAHFSGNTPSNADQKHQYDPRTQHNTTYDARQKTPTPASQQQYSQFPNQQNTWYPSQAPPNTHTYYNPGSPSQQYYTAFPHQNDPKPKVPKQQQHVPPPPPTIQYAPPQQQVQYAPSLHNMTSPLPFEGNKDENYALFEHQLKAAIQIHRIPPTEQVAVLFLKLAGKAQKFFISLQQHQKGDFDTATWHLRNRYQNPNRAWMHSAAFKNRMWQQDVESVEDYVLELKTLAAIAFETEAEQMIQVRAQFQVGIPTYLKRKIITHTHETLAQWVERISMQIAINDACPTQH